MLITPWRNVLMERALRKATSLHSTPFKLKDRTIFLQDQPHSTTLGHVYHEMATGFYEPLKPIQRGDRILDIGGHVGTWTIINALRNPYANFFVVEPDWYNFNNLQANIQRHKLYNVHMMFIGLGDGNRVEVKHNKINTGSSQTFRSAYAAVETQSLSQIIQRIGGKVSLLKMDCEGAEHEGLDSLKGIHSIIAEIHARKINGDCGYTGQPCDSCIKDAPPGMDTLQRISESIPEHRLTYQPTGHTWERGERWISPGAVHFP